MTSVLDRADVEFLKQEVLDFEQTNGSPVENRVGPDDDPDKAACEGGCNGQCLSGCKDTCAYLNK